MEPRDFNIDAVLRDGETVHIRAIRPDDKQRLLDGFHRLTNRSVYSRFFQFKETLNNEELTYLTEVDFIDHVALVATLPGKDHHEIIGVGRYIRTDLPGQEVHAEFALAVADRHQGRGTGSLLLQNLIIIALSAGISVFEADILTENRQMLKVLEHSGFKLNTTNEGGFLHVSFTL